MKSAGVLRDIAGRAATKLKDKAVKAVGEAATSADAGALAKKVLEHPEVKKAKNKALLAVGGTALGASALGGYAGARAARPKTAGAIGSFLRSPQGIGALAGAGVGMGTTALEATGHGPDLNKVRERIAKNDASMKQPGLRGFAKAMDLATDRVLLTMGETVQAHPVASTFAAGVLGGIGGAGLGQETAELLREAKSYHTGPWPRTV